MLDRALSPLSREEATNAEVEGKYRRDDAEWEGDGIQQALRIANCGDTNWHRLLLSFLGLKLLVYEVDTAARYIECYNIDFLFDGIRRLLQSCYQSSRKSRSNIDSNQSRG